MFSTVKRLIPEGIKKKWRANARESVVFEKPMDFSFLSKIKEAHREKLIDATYLEQELIPQLGLNNESLHEFPEALYPSCGYGLFIWQYPNQMAPLLAELAKYSIRSYLEVGVRHGGMFLGMIEWLSKVNQSDIYGLAVDITTSSPLENQLQKHSQLNYWIGDSQSTRFKKHLKNQPHFDLTLIDADHSYEGCLADYNAVKETSSIILFHDIVSEVCPGVVEVWNKVKQDETYQCFEFVEQYPELKSKGHSYLGIGMAVNKTLIKPLS